MKSFNPTKKPLFNICTLYIFSLFFLLFDQQLSAQNLLPKAQADSLLRIWQDNTKHDTLRLEAIYCFIWEGFLDSEPDSAIYYAQQQYAFAKSVGNSSYMSRALNCLGLAYADKSEQAKAIQYLYEALEISEKSANQKAIAGTLTNLGSCFNDQGNYSKAIDVYGRAISIHEAIGNKPGIAICANALGWLYLSQGNGERATFYFNRGLAIARESKDITDLGDSYNNLANIAQFEKNYIQAKVFLDSALLIFQKANSRAGAAIVTGNIGQNYVKLGDFAQARPYYLMALAETEKLGNLVASSRLAINLGIVDNKEEKYRSALVWCEKGLKTVERIGNIDLEEQACECLYVAYKGLGEGAKALIYHERMLMLNEQLDKATVVRKLQLMEFDKAMLQDSINKAETARLLQEAHLKEIRSKNRTQNIALVIVGVVLMLAAGLYNRLRFVRNAKAELQVEKDRSEVLLHNILPEEIAQELKLKGRSEARDFDLVSILFTDFKGFTEQSASMSATALVNEINVCFETFDKIMEKFGIEKIKTIGDAYMAAGGLPVPSAVSVKNTVLAALEMQTFITQRKAENEVQDLPAFEMRVGIHTGPVVAGIVGVKKFQYDIWGDTVNTAARMEQNGEVGKVNISKNTYNLIENDSLFEFESRGRIAAKGKGEMEMFFVRLKNQTNSN